MSQHPNVILFGWLEGTTGPQFLEAFNHFQWKDGIETRPGWEDEDSDRLELVVKQDVYTAYRSRGDYNDDKQLETKDGALVFWDAVTYGYGEAVKIEELVRRHTGLQDVLKEVAAKLGVNYGIRIGANFW